MRGLERDNLKERAKGVRERARRAFTKRSNFETLWQVQAEIFYPERADFTTEWSDGAERYEGLATSEPQMLRRDLANTMGAMLRPRGRPWFAASVDDIDLESDHEAKQWLQRATNVQRKIVYDSEAFYTRAMAVSDADYVTFGNSVVMHTYRSDETGMLFKCIHLRDAAWTRNQDLQVDKMYIKMRITLRNVIRLFGKENLPVSWKRMTEQKDCDYQQLMTIYQCTAPLEPGMYDSREIRLRGATHSSLYVAECDDQDGGALGEGFFRDFPFTVREWSSVSDEDYARSPATSVGLADSRTLNIAQESLLTAIETAVRPPKYARPGALLGDVNLGADEITWVDDDWDERDGPPIKNLETGDPRFGTDFVERQSERIARAFFQDLITIPDREMTAYEVSERMEMYIREAAPIFEPMEAESAHMMDSVFTRAMWKGAFGEVDFDADGFLMIDGMPDQLADREVEFEFETPLSQALKKQKAIKADQLIVRAQSIVSTQVPQAVEALDHVNWDSVVRDAVDADSPAEWLKNPDDVERIRAERAEEMARQQAIEQAKEIGGEMLKARPENLARAEEMLSGDAEV